MATRQRPMGMQSLQALSAGKRGTLCVDIRVQQSDRWSHSLKLRWAAEALLVFKDCRHAVPISIAVRGGRQRCQDAACERAGQPAACV